MTSELIFPLRSMDTALNPPEQAHLHVMSGRWALVSNDGSAAMELDPSVLIHYPIRGAPDAPAPEEAHVA